MRSVVAAASLFALAVVLFSDGTRTLFAPSMTSVRATPVNSLPASYPVSVEQISHPVPAQHDTAWSSIAMLAVVGTAAGVAVSSAMKGKNKQSPLELPLTAPAFTPAQAVRTGPVTMQEEEEAPAAVVPARAPAAVAVYGDDAAVAGLKDLAKKLNPVVGYYDPLNLAEANFWDQGTEATVGFLRHAEIKHGRVAMAGFVGFIVHANGIHFPWKVPGDELCAEGVSPPLLWQGIPEEAKWQIILTIGLFELYSEAAMAKTPGLGGHYMRGGKPGLFPAFKPAKGEGKKGIPTDDEGNVLLPHPVPLNLYDPFNLNKNKSDEWKADKLNIEINNGRLAMLGLMAFLSEGAVPGSVPALKGLIPSSGEINVMSPLDFTKPFFG